MRTHPATRAAASSDRLLSNPVARRSVVLRVSTRDAPPSPKNVDSLPSPPGPAFFWPVVGDLPDVQKRGALMFGVERHQQYGRVSKMSFLGEAALLLTNTKDMVQLLQTDGYTVAFNASDAFNRLMGGGDVDDASDKFGTEVMLAGEKRRQQRRIMMRGLSTDALTSYAPFVEACVTATLEEWARRGSIELRRDVRLLTVDLANGLLVGVDFSNSEREEVQELMDSFFKGAYAAPIDLPGTTLWKAMRARERLVEILGPHLERQKDSILADREITLSSGDKRLKKSVVGYMMEVRKELGYPVTRGAMIQLAIGMLMAGVDTSGSGLTTTLFILTQLPEVVEKLREEQARVVAAHGPALTKAALDAMPFAEAVAKECQFWAPSGSLNFRRALQDMEVAGFKVPKGQLMVLNIHAAHALQHAARVGLDPGTLPLPEMRPGGRADVSDVAWLRSVFEPERWMGPPPPGTDAPYLLAFHSGPHTCAGLALYYMEAKALLAGLVRGYDLAYAGDVGAVAFQDFPLRVPTTPLPATVTRRRAPAA